ncbi:MAG: sigma-70 family RNA polymerase sigma factor, partial [Mangrovicoccus sp.]|nr:sigma-70 family RNA polymerase sigma factor [Mangrovicoccus sp.]
MLSTGQILTDHMPFPVTRETMSLPFGIGKNAQAMTNGPQDQLSDPTAWLIAVRDRRDRDAFAQLFRYYAPRLRAMLARTGCRGAAADDIIQDALMRVWHSAGQFDASRASASAWVYRIARNRQIDILRRTARPVPEALKAEDPPDPDASGQVAFDQEARRLRGALDRLSPDQRAVIEQAYMGELSHSEI